MTTYDVIVIGLGAMGSATAYWLARRGHRVLGLEAFAPGHTFGASHGRSRIIREAYFEAPVYVPLVHRAYVQWRELEQESHRSLLTITGGITIGQQASLLVQGALASSQLHHLPHELLAADQIRRRYPGLRPTEDLVGVVEPNAGILDPEACMAAFTNGAAASGAALHFEEAALAWTEDGGGVQVQTARDVYHAQRLVVTAGAWTSRLLPDLQLPLVVHRVVNVHFEPRDPGRYQPEQCPIHLWAVPEGQYYGFPALPGQGLKFGRHDISDVCTPETMRREVSDSEIKRLRDVLEKYLPGASGPTKWTITCTYTHTPDQHFIIDRHPAQPTVSVGCGFSGHGFKFAPVIGEALADLATETTPHPSVEFFSAARFASSGSSEGAYAVETP